MPAPVPAKAPVWSRDYAYGRDDTNPGAAIPPPNVTPWLAPSVVSTNTNDARNQFIDDVYGSYPQSYLGTMAANRHLASTTELGNIQLRQPGGGYDNKDMGQRYDPLYGGPKTAPDPAAIGAGGGYLAGSGTPVPAGMVVNPYWELPGQEPYITQEAYDALYAPGGVAGPGQYFSGGQARPAPDAYDATLLTAMRNGETNAETLGYDPGASWQRENDYYAALKMRNDIGNATSAGYVTRQNPDGTYQVSGLTTPNAQGQWMPDARANVNDVNIRSTYNIGSPPYGKNKPGKEATITQDPLQYLMSQEINPNQARLMPGYSGDGAKGIVAPFGATGMKWPGVDEPLGGQTYEEAIAKGATDPTLAGLYANNAPPSVVPGGTGAAGLAAPGPRQGTPGTGADWISSVPVEGAPPPGTDRDVELKAIMRDLNALGDAERRALYVAGDSRYKELRKAGYILYEDGSVAPSSGGAPAPAPMAAPTPDVQAAADRANADGYYMGIPLADWRATLATLSDAEQADYLASNPLLAEKLLRGYASGGVWNMDNPVMVGENGPEILSGTSGGDVNVTPFRAPLPSRRSTAVAPANPGGSGPVTSPGIPESQVTRFPSGGGVPWYEQDLGSGRGGRGGDPGGGAGSGSNANPWDGKAIQMPVDFWGKTALDRQAYFEGQAGSQYNPEYLAQLAEKYRLAGTSGYARRTGY